MSAKQVRYTRCRKRPSDFGWAVIREALQTASADLPELMWLPEIGWMVSWD